MLLASNGITWPSGFTQWGMVGVQNVAQIFVGTKTLSGADSGNYVSTLSGTRFHQSDCVLLDGGGSIVAQDANNAKTGSGGTISSLSVTTTGAPGLVQFVANANDSTHTPATCSRRRRRADYIAAYYRIPGTTGSHTATAATISAGGGWASVLVAVEPAGGGGGAPSLMFLSPLRSGL